MFDLSIGEIAIILIAILVFVPSKDLPTFAYKIGKGYQKIKMFLLKVKNQWHDIYQQLEDDIEEKKNKEQQKVTKTKRRKKNSSNKENSDKESSNKKNKKISK